MYVSRPEEEGFPDLFPEQKRNPSTPLPHSIPPWYADTDQSGDLVYSTPGSSEGMMVTTVLVWIALSAFSQEDPTSREWTIAGLFKEVGPRIDRTFLYDNSLNLDTKSVTTPALPPEMPNAQLVRILQKALQVNGLVMVAPDVEGDPWTVYHASRSQKLSLRVLGSSEEVPSDYGMYTRVYSVRQITPRELPALLVNRVSFPQGIHAVQEAGIVLVTDYASNLRKLDKIVALADRAPAKEPQPPVDPHSDPENKEAPPAYKSRNIHSSQSRDVWLMDPKEIQWTLEIFPEDMKKTIGFEPNENGLQVTRINSGGIGLSRGLQLKDTVLSVNGQSIKSAVDLEKSLKDPRNERRRSIIIVVYRDGRKVVIEYRSEKGK